MNIDGNFIPIFAIAVGFVITITAILADSITKYKLKVEQIKADALVRAEEVRTRNQLELEKLLQQDQTYNNNTYANNRESTLIYDENNKVKSRVRE